MANPQRSHNKEILPLLDSRNGHPNFWFGEYTLGAASQKTTAETSGSSYFAARTRKESPFPSFTPFNEVIHVCVH